MLIDRQVTQMNNSLTVQDYLEDYYTEFIYYYILEEIYAVSGSEPEDTETQINALSQMHFDTSSSLQNTKSSLRKYCNEYAKVLVSELANTTDEKEILQKQFSNVDVSTIESLQKSGLHNAFKSLEELSDDE